VLLVARIETLFTPHFALAFRAWSEMNATVALRVPAAPSHEDLLSALPIAVPKGSNGRSLATIVAINQAAQRYRPEILRPTRVPMA